MISNLQVDIKPVAYLNEYFKRNSKIRTTQNQFLSKLIVKKSIMRKRPKLAPG
jgi:hypothetical protein